MVFRGGAVKGIEEDSDEEYQSGPPPRLWIFGYVKVIQVSLKFQGSGMKLPPLLPPNMTTLPLMGSPDGRDQEKTSRPTNKSAVYPWPRTDELARTTAAYTTPLRKLAADQRPWCGRHAADFELKVEM